MNSSQRQILNPYQRLRPGCYALRYQSHKPYEGSDANPSAPDDGESAFEGTLRVVHYNNEGNRALPMADAPSGEANPASDEESARESIHGQVLYLSGDLYASESSRFGEPLREIPIYPRSDYRFYLLATDIREAAHGEFDLHLRSREFVNGEWADRGEVIARLGWVQAPEGSRSLFDYLTGTVHDPSGEELGVISLNWISPFLRRAVIEFDRVSQVRLPLNNHTCAAFSPALENHRNWHDVFRACGWEITTRISDQPAEPASKIWSEPELQQALPALRDTFDLDHEWRFHVFCVGRLEDGGRGYKFDLHGVDGRENPFESIVIAARFQFADNPNDPALGRLAGRFLEDTPAYFRTCVHELGHALKLDHNFQTNGFMATTDAILQEHENRRMPDRKGRDKAKVDGDAMNLVDWEFEEGDLQRLRHWPDIVVRPGGGARKLNLPGIDAFRMVPLLGGQSGSKDAPLLRLEALPFAEEIPLGAPARIQLTLRNLGPETVTGPALRLKSGHISGAVIGDDGLERPFLPLAETLDALDSKSIPAEQPTQGSLTLLRGPDGPLFPTPGRYTVRVELRVFLRRRYYLFTANTKITVRPFEDDKQRRIATLLLETRQSLLTLAVGGDGLTDGNQAVNLALSHPILGPHFQIVRLKRLVRGIGRVRGYLGEALAILCATGPKAAVLTPTELISLVRLVRPGPARDNPDEAEEANVPLTHYLTADLRHVAVRLVLGRLNDKTIEVFHSLVRHQTKDVIERKAGPTQGKPPLVTSFKAQSILEGILRLQVGLSRNDSRELGELLYAGEHSVWSALLEELEKPQVSNMQRIRSAAARVGLPLADFSAAVKRFQQASDSQPDRLPPSELHEFASELFCSLEEAPLASSSLNEVFRENLKENLKDAGLVVAHTTKSRPRPPTPPAQPEPARP
jgi:hypothetical protein